MVLYFDRSWEDQDESGLCVIKKRIVPDEMPLFPECSNVSFKYSGTAKDNNNRDIVMFYICV